MSNVTVTLDLPTPPSVNRIWRSRRAGAHRVSLSPEYQRWKKEADALSLATGQLKGLRTIPGAFVCAIVVKRVRGDIDNRSKGVLDWLQSRGVVANDKNCDLLVIAWGEAPTGCRVTVSALPDPPAGCHLRVGALA